MASAKDKTAGKALSALLQILRSNGVTRYQTPDLTLELAPAAKGGASGRAAPRTVNVSPEALAAEAEAGGDVDGNDEDEPGDMRFGLERLTRRHFPAAKADPRRNKGVS